MRGKFQVLSITRFTGTTAIKVELTPVTNTEPENKQFWNMTPSGRLEMTVTNPDAVSFFQVDKSYYLDFTEV